MLERQEAPYSRAQRNRDKDAMVLAGRVGEPVGTAKIQ